MDKIILGETFFLIEFLTHCVQNFQKVIISLKFIKYNYL
jgi:hypothetical protein